MNDSASRPRTIFTHRRAADVDGQPALRSFGRRSARPEVAAELFHEPHREVSHGRPPIARGRAKARWAIEARSFSSSQHHQRGDTRFSYPAKLLLAYARLRHRCDGARNRDGASAVDAGRSTPRAYR